jgi:adenosylmethionine-8-amino-7-oxononanoate aminotransferase
MTRKQGPIWHPFTQHALQGEMTKIVRGEGAYLTTADGRRIIDAIASWWVVTHGHCHPHIVNAIQKQAERLNQIIFAGHTHEPAEELAAQLLKSTPRNLEYVFFSDSGSTSVEVALKMALGYWNNIGKPRLSRRHRRNHVGRRAWRVQRSLRTAAVRGHHDSVSEIRSRAGNPRCARSGMS